MVMALSVTWSFLREVDDVGEALYSGADHCESAAG